MASSDSDGIMQHSAFTWLSDGDQFITEPDFRVPAPRLLNEELNHWIATLTPEQREACGAHPLFTVLHANGATSFSEVMSNFPASIPAVAWRVRWADPRRPASGRLRPWPMLRQASTAKRKPTPAPASAPSSATSKATAEIPSRNCSRSR